VVGVGMRRQMVHTGENTDRLSLIPLPKFTDKGNPEKVQV
jgi:hypothetical protein